MVVILLAWRRSRRSSRVVRQVQSVVGLWQLRPGDAAEVGAERNFDTEMLEDAVSPRDLPTIYTLWLIHG